MNLAAPAPPKGARQTGCINQIQMKKTLIAILTVTALLLAAAAFFDEPPRGMKDSIFIIQQNMPLKVLAGELEKQNLVTSGTFFRIMCTVMPGYKYMAGKYRIYPGLSTHEIIRMFSEGKQISLKVTIPEGYNIYEIAGKLDENGITSGRDFLKYAQDRSFLAGIGIESTSAEGYLFPDTYVFTENMDARNVIKIMHKRFLSVIKSIGYDSINQSGMKLGDVVRMASLIEKEAAVPSERKYVSSVFHNRMKKGMRFDCDPTVRYALRKFGGRLYLDDLKVDSPYNTYIHTGFPPTAICCPGRDSIIAAIRPAQTEYLYFVARNDRSHYFSVNLREHNRAVERYIKGINNGFSDTQRLD